jgi:hypothetical protein
VRCKNRVVFFSRDYTRRQLLAQQPQHLCHGRNALATLCLNF